MRRCGVALRARSCQDSTLTGAQGVLEIAVQSRTGWRGACHARRKGHPGGSAAIVLRHPAFLLLFLSQSPLREHVGGDEEAEEQQQGSGDEQLRGEGRAVVMDLRAGGTADRAATLDDRAGAVRADQVLAAHLKSLPVAVPRRTWRDLEP